MSDEQTFHGTPLDEDEIADNLCEHGHGVLSLARDDDAYSIPVSFGYDRDSGRIFIVLIGYTESNTKAEYVEATEQAQLVVTDVNARDDWESVIATGTLEEVKDGEDTNEIADVLADNAMYPDLVGTSTPVYGPKMYEFHADEITGLTAVTR